MRGIDKANVFWRRVDGRTVVVNTETGRSCSLDGSAEMLWEGLAAGKNPAQLAEVLTEAYEVDEHTAAEDVETFLSGLEKEGFIR